MRSLTGHTLDSTVTTTFGYMSGKDKGFFGTSAQLPHNRDDIRYNVPRFLDNDCVTNPHIESFNFILIMERSTRNSRSGNNHRFELRYWCHNPCPTHLKHNVANNGRHLFCRKLERNTPSRCFAGITETILHTPLICFDNNTINKIILSFRFFLPMFPISNRTIDVFHEFVVWVHLEPKLREEYELTLLRFWQHHS